jgi:hypothetical protein
MSESETTKNPELQPTEWISVKQFCARNPGVSSWLIGEMIRKSELDCVRLGRRILLPANALRLLADRQHAARGSGCEANHAG